MRLSVLLLLLAACSDKSTPIDTGDPVDTGPTQCGRVRGTENVLLYQGDAVRSPVDYPDATTNATGVAGPLGDDATYVALVHGEAMLSTDAGCNWDGQGRLPATQDFRLLAAGTRVYAIDTLSSSGSRTDDYGLSWTPFDATEAFIGLPVVDAADPNHLRGLQSRGVVDSIDGGDTWTLGNPLPVEATTPTDADVSPGNLDVAVLAASTGAWRTTDAGATWTPIITDAAVGSIAIHPDDPTVIFAASTDADSVTTVSRSADGGTNWNRLVDSASVSLSTSPPLWPVPGNALQALSSNGPVHNDNTATDGVNLYEMEEGVGTHTVYVGTWYHLTQLTFGSDRWVASADAMP